MFFLIHNIVFIYLLLIFTPIITKKIYVMEKLLEQIKAEYNAFVENADLQVEKNNKAAGMRARKNSLNLEKLMKEFRKLSLDESKK